MKRLAILLLVIVLTTEATVAGLQTGLVAHYAFSGNAVDQTGNGHNGTVYGAVLTTDRFGNPNSAYRFDGLDDYVRIPNSPELDGMHALTVSVWINTGSDGQYEEEVINKYNHYSGSHLGGSYNIGIGDRGLLSGFQYATKDAYVIKTSGMPLSKLTWHHLVAVYTGHEGLYYVDGIKVPLSRNDPDSSGQLNSISADLLIGCGESNGSLFHFFTGSIDDVRIYNRALSADEVNQLYTIPEPATLLLLGLGGLLIRKR